MEMTRQQLLRHTRRATELCSARNAILVYLVRCGSHAYGTDTPDSDEDIRGVFIPPWRDMIGLSMVHEGPRYSPQQIMDDEHDIVLFSIQKFAKLCLAGNPNILDWLFVDHEDVIMWHGTFPLRSMPEKKVLSLRLLTRFAGYAHSHLTKMEPHSTRNLGAARKASVERFGYSTKNAMHLIRLSQMGLQCIREGRYQVRRPNVEELLAIKRGEWSLERIKTEGGRLLQEMAEAAKGSPLPPEPKWACVEQDVMNCVLANRRW